MRIALVDSCKDARQHTEELLRRCLLRHGIAAEIHHFHSGKALLTRFTPGRFSAIFLDVDIGSFNNLKTAHAIRASDARCLLIFLSKGSEYMSEAFSCHAFDYIIKPLTQARLAHLFDDILRALPIPEKCLAIRWCRQDVRIPYRQIVCLTANRNNTEIHDLRGGTWTTRTKFSALAAALADDARFLDVNRGILVNMEHVIDIDESGCKLAYGVTYPVRVRKKREIRMKWIQHKSEQI